MHRPNEDQAEKLEQLRDNGATAFGLLWRDDGTAHFRYHMEGTDIECVLELDGSLTPARPT